MIGFSKKNQYKLKFHFRRLAILTPTSIQIIETSGLKNLKILTCADEPGPDSAAGRYSVVGDLGYGDKTLFRCDDKKLAERVFRALYISNSYFGMGWLNRWVKVASVLGVTWILIAALASSTGGSPPRSPNLADSLAMETTSGGSSQSLDEARELLRKRLKSEALSATGEHYQFNPKINVPVVAAPDLNCAPKQVEQKISK